MSKTEAATNGTKPTFAQQLAALGVIDKDMSKAEQAEQKTIMASVIPDKQILIDVDLDDLEESPMNPRRQWGDMDGLAKTIDAQGVLEPLLVRHLGTPAKGGKAKYQIAAGHRRFRGAKKAGRKTVPCVVRELTDAQVAEIQAVENGQRKDLHPLEAAESYGNMVKHGYSVPTIAAKVGKSEGHVYTHLKVLELSPEAKTAFLTVKDDGQAKLDLSVAIPLARYPHDLQAQALKELLSSKNAYWSARDQIRWLQREFCRHLKNAPFSLKDDLLPVVPAKTGAQPAGACVTCPRNTKNQHADLFGDFDKGDRTGPGICTFTPCFEKRAALGMEAKVAKAEAEGVKVLDAEASRAAMAYSSGFARLEEVEHAHPKKLTRKAIVNALPDDKRPQVYLATQTDSEGVTKPIMVVKEAEFRKAVIDATDAKWAKHSDKLSSGGSDNYTKQQTARLKRIKIERQVAKATIEQLVAKLRDKGLTRPDAEQFALSTLDTYHGQRVQLPALFGKENDRDLRKWVTDTATTADLIVFCMAAHAAQSWIPEYQPGQCDELTTLAKVHKIDMKALEADFAPKKKKAKKAAK